MCNDFSIIAWVFKSRKVMASGYYDSKKCSQYAIQKLGRAQQFRVFCQELLVIQTVRIVLNNVFESLVLSGLSSICAEAHHQNVYPIISSQAVPMATDWL